MFEPWCGISEGGRVTHSKLSGLPQARDEITTKIVALRPPLRNEHVISFHEVIDARELLEAIIFSVLQEPRPFTDHVNKQLGWIRAQILQQPRPVVVLDSG